MSKANKTAQDRRALIKAAAIELFASRGFQATPTSEVAKKAGVSEGIIFYHFQTKEGILVSLYEEIMEEFLVAIGKVLAESADGLAAVVGCLDLQLAFSKERSQETLIIVRDLPPSLGDANSPFRERMESGKNRLLALLEKAIVKGQEDGSIRPCHPTQNALVLLGFLTGMSKVRLLSSPDIPPFQEAVHDFCRHALASRPGYVDPSLQSRER